jgi:maleylacetate reductase
MLQFTYEALPARVIFGVGSVKRVGEEVARLGAERALVLSTPGQRSLAEAIAAQLGSRAAGIFSGAVMHVPVEVVEAAQGEAVRLGADLCVAVGGGSTVGLAKALALKMGLPIVAIPTTYAGSEMTPIWGLTDGGAKRTGRDPRVLPKCVIYDPEMTVGLPPSVSGSSGMNAIAHCVEALYAPDGNPIVALMAEEGVRALATSLPRLVREPRDLEARSQALYGAWLAGASLGAVSMGLHHKLCHTLGGLYNLPHAEMHAIILPHAVRYNAAAAPEAMGKIARALDVDDAPGGLFDLAREVGAPIALSYIGMREEELDRAAERATCDPYSNPAPVTTEGVRELLENAYHGARPGSARA